MKERKFQEAIGRHLVDSAELLDRLPQGVAKVVLRRGVPEEGTGRYSVPNEFARIASEQHISTLDRR